MNVRLMLPTLLVVAGLGQVALVVVGLALPRVRGWVAETAELRPLTRQAFWTGTVYLWCTNLGFGLISTVAPGWLVDRSPLAAAATIFFALYWGARLVLQLFFFDWTDVPSSRLLQMGESVVVGLFLYLTFVYGAATVVNLSRGG
jgi:hypothetical protein